MWEEGAWEGMSGSAETVFVDWVGVVLEDRAPIVSVETFSSEVVLVSPQAIIAVSENETSVFVEEASAAALFEEAGQETVSLQNESVTIFEGA